MDVREHYVELGLRDPAAAAVIDAAPSAVVPLSPAAPLSPAPATDPALARFADRLMALLHALAPESDTIETARFRATIDGYRRTVADPGQRGELARTMEACVETCERYFRRARQYRSERDAEFTEIIGMLREAAKVALGDSSEFHAEMIETSDRIGRLTDLDDMRELKQRIAGEVQALRASVLDKQRRDERAYTQLAQRVEALQERLARVEEEASIDPLTRVANRGGFQRAMTRMIEQARTRDMPLTLAMLDVDDFKAINDTHGHPIGDRVLLCTAQRLTRNLRQTDFVARYGGEEFAVLLAGAAVAQVEERLKQVVTDIASSSYEYTLMGEKQKVDFTVSCGMTDLQATDTAETFVQRADNALYEAKRKGKNRVVTRRRSALKSLLAWG